MARPLALQDDDWNDAESEEDEAEALFDDADSLLESMKRLRAQVLETVDTLPGKTQEYDSASKEMHSKLKTSVLDIFADVAAGRGPEVSSEALASSAVRAGGASSSAAAEGEADLSLDGPAVEQRGGDDDGGDLLSEPHALLEIAATQQPQQPAPSRKGTSSRFRSASLDFESKSVVGDISRLASKPLLGDSNDMMRSGPANRRQLASGGGSSGGSGLYSSSSVMGKSLPRRL